MAAPQPLPLHWLCNKYFPHRTHSHRNQQFLHVDPKIEFFTNSWSFNCKTAPLSIFKRSIANRKKNTRSFLSNPHVWPLASSQIKTIYPQWNSNWYWCGVERKLESKVRTMSVRLILLRTINRCWTLFIYIIIGLSDKRPTVHNDRFLIYLFY